MGSSDYALIANTALPPGWKGHLVVAFVSLSLLSCFELAVLTIAVWNNKTKVYFWSILVATTCSFLFTVGIMLFFFAPTGKGSQWLSMILTVIGYVLYIPAQFTVMYTRLYLLRPSARVMLVCKTVLIAEWVIFTIPNAILSAGAAMTTEHNFPNAYSISQRIEPAAYATVSLMLSSLYIYHAYVMFKRYGDKRVRNLLVRLLYTNLFLIALDSGNIIAEYAGGATIQTGYVAFFYSFQLKIELWMLNDIGLLASETLERSRILRPLEIETGSFSVD